MKKPWSITTTIRNPDRIKGFLKVASEMEGSVWNTGGQEKFQILLIQHRLYGYGKRQFYNNLSDKNVALMEDLSKDISYEQAKDIFFSKTYRDYALRGRTSMSILTKMALVSLEEKTVRLTDYGQEFKRPEGDIGETLLNFFLKWQIPNPLVNDYDDDAYNIKPFIGVFHLIDTVNKKETKARRKAKGLSREEFCLFCPTLVHHNDIEDYSNKIIDLRLKREGKSKEEQKNIFERYKEEFSKEFLGLDDKLKIEKFLGNLKDYGDNAIRYFRLTRYIQIRGNGYYIDLEPRRSVEISALLDQDSGIAKNFTSKKEYIDYISNKSLPILPWETDQKFSEIIANLKLDIETLEISLNLTEKYTFQISTHLSLSEKKEYVDALRAYRRKLQENSDYTKSQSAETLEKYIEDFKNIYHLDNKPILLEKLSTLGLQAMNDALDVKPNYPVGDDNEPTFTAPANVPDIECYYKSFNMICEVTMLKSRDQWYNEGQPVMRHLRDFETKNAQQPAFCLFISPKTHRDTFNTFLVSVKHGYEGKKQKIIPISIEDFITILNVVLELKKENRGITHAEILQLYESIIKKLEQFDRVEECYTMVPEQISKWRDGLR